MAPHDNLAGQVWEEAIVDVIDSAKGMVVLLSHQSSESQHVRREVARAAECKIPVLPLRLHAEQ